MTTDTKADERIAAMRFASVYPLYIAKLERKGSSRQALDEAIAWLTGFDSDRIRELIQQQVTFATFFEQASLNPKAQNIRGKICGHDIAAIQNPLTRKVRYLDKLVDELAKGKPLEKILSRLDV